MISRGKLQSVVSLIAGLFCLTPVAVWAKKYVVEDEYDFRITHRINAHGDEFMSLALTPDGQRLVVGTEKGELIVWGVREQRVLKQLNQGSPVHCVVALDANHLVAAGGPHSGSEERGVIRKWDIDAGTFEEWKGTGNVTFLTLAADPRTGLVGAGNLSGVVLLWNSSDGRLMVTRDLKQPVIGLALINRILYVTTIAKEEVKKIDDDVDHRSTNAILTFSVDQLDRPAHKLVSERSGKLWGELRPSPDGRMLAARFAAGGDGVALLEAANGKEIATFDHRAAAWTSNGEVVLFDEEVPTQLAHITAQGKVSLTELLKSGSWHASGTPSHMAGQVVSSDGSMVWEIFQLGATLVECNLGTKGFDVRLNIVGLPFAMDVLERSSGDEFLVTGGDDRFVRVRKLSDLSLVKEFQVNHGVPQGVALLADGRHVVFSFSSKDSPTEIVLADFVSGEQKQLLNIPAPFVRVAAAANAFIYNLEDHLVLVDPKTGETRDFAVNSKVNQFSVSANGNWLAVADDKGTLYCFETATGKRVAVSADKIDSLSGLTVTNDGRYAYTTEWLAALKQWDIRSNTTKELASVRGQAHSLRVSSDGKRIAIGGNHRDVAVYDTAKGHRLLYFQTEASDFYVTNVWLRGDRLVFTTDAGVMKDGMIVR